MNAPTSLADQRNGNSSAPLWLAGVFGVLVCLLAINSQSLWIDEALTAWKAKQPTPNGWWQAMVDEKASDLQMPLYMVYIWAYEKVFGSSEWVLRSANIPWFVLGLIAFAAAFSASTQRRLAVTLAVACSPFAWYYLNEARPYAMQLGASLLIFAALYRLIGECGVRSAECGMGHSALWVRGLLAGIVVLCGSSMLGMIWAASAVAVTLVVFSRRGIRELLRSYRWGWLLASGFVLLFGCYYLWTLWVGARASGAATTDWKNLLFIGYELLGFSGLGPGRLEIRQGGYGVFQRHWLELTLNGISVLILLGASIRQLLLSGDRKLILKLGLIVVAPAVVLVVAGIALHFRLLGRHFAPLMPVVFFLLGLGLTTLWARRSLVARAVVCGFFVLSLLSSLSVRFAARHEKDNYRDAAAFARLALQDGQKVWWNAERHGATYYQVPTTIQPREVYQALWLMNPSLASLSNVPAPNVIIASKPDIFDNQGALAEYIERAGFRKTATLAAFTVWKRTGE